MPPHPENTAAPQPVAIPADIEMRTPGTRPLFYPSVLAWFRLRLACYAGVAILTAAGFCVAAGVISLITG